MNEPVQIDLILNLVRFYDNHGQLYKVAHVTGVEIENLQKFLDGKGLSDEDRNKLEVAVARNEGES